MLQKLAVDLAAANLRGGGMWPPLCITYGLAPQGEDLLREMAAGDRLAGTQAVPESCRETAKGTCGLWRGNDPEQGGFQL